MAKCLSSPSGVVRVIAHLTKSMLKTMCVCVWVGDGMQEELERSIGRERRNGRVCVGAAFVSVNKRV